MGLPVAGEFANGTGLNNGGEQIKLDDASGSTILEFEYDDSDGWPGQADGGGFTLVVLNLEGDYGSRENWQASLVDGGTPGEAEEDLPMLPGDYNGSGLVEQADLDLVLTNWGRSATPPPANWIHDLPTGAIDQGELDAVLINWGRSTAGFQSPPAPAELRTADSAKAPAPLRTSPSRSPLQKATHVDAGDLGRWERLQALEFAFASLSLGSR
jgi:hypothetical protein